MRWIVSAVLLAVGTFGPFPRLAAAQDATEERVATPTFMGDRGLWFVPSAEVPKSGEWSLSGYRTDMNRNEGFTNVSFMPVTGSVGVGNRVEVFGSLRITNRIDRDTRPLFFPAPPEGGGALYDYPFARVPFSQGIGDLRIGAKFNLVSQERGGPVAVAVRGIMKLPTASSDEGTGTGKVDFSADAIVSSEINRRVELSGFGGIVMRANPDAFSLSDSFRWGFGADFPTRKALRVSAELFGEIPFDDTLEVLGAPLVGSDGSVSPSSSSIDSDVYGNLGLTWLHRNGFFVGGGLTYRFNTDKRSDVLPTYTDSFNDAVGWQFRIGFSPRKRRPAPAPVAATTPAPPALPPVTTPAPPPPPAAAPAPAPANRPPTVTVVCNPCEVRVGQSLTLQATAQDPDGDPLTYRWAVPAGTLATPTAATTQWTAETVPSSVVATVTVSDGRGGSVTGTANLLVVAAGFGDVFFDFDRSTLRPDALATLQQVLAALRARPTMRLLIEGHASAEGTAEYNLGLGARRSSAVLEYLATQGIDRARLSTVSYGEERPKFPNTTEAERAMNRRAAFVAQ